MTVSGMAGHTEQYCLQHQWTLRLSGVEGKLLKFTLCNTLMASFEPFELTEGTMADSSDFFCLSCSVYTRGLWAVPTVVPRASAPTPSQAAAAAAGAERRLQEFVTRELRALLEEEVGGGALMSLSLPEFNLASLAIQTQHW